MSKHFKKKPVKDIILRTVTVLLSAVLLYFGNNCVTKDLSVFTGEDTTVRAEVTELGERIESKSPDGTYTNTIQVFFAKITEGENKGTIVVATQESDNFSVYKEADIKPGDKILLYKNYYNPSAADWVFGGFYRLGYIGVLAAFFVILLLFFGRIKGLNTTISLVFTIIAVFAVFIPSILNGYNIYWMTAVTCIYTIIMTLFITSGFCAKSFTTILGCGFGVAVAAALNLLLSRMMHLSGIIDEHSVYLQYLENGKSINLVALIFAMTTIGAMGAVMDVAMDISSSLAEIHFRNPALSFKEHFKSGIRIGRDIMGTMANTLVLAYVGSSLCSTLLYITYSSSLIELMNKEGVIVELLQSLIGSLSILLTIPLTSFVCSVLYSKKTN